MASKKTSAKKSVRKSTQDNSRGIKLTLLLILISLFALNLSIAAFDFNFSNDLQYYLVTLTRVLYIVGIILMWMWKRLGIFLYAAGVLLILFLPPLFAEQNGLPRAHPIEYWYLLAAAAILFGLHYIILKPKWHLFK